MSRRHPSTSPSNGVVPRELLLSHDEAIGLVVALVCALASALLFLSLPVTARADESDDLMSVDESLEVTEGDAPLADDGAHEAGREFGEPAAETAATGLTNSAANSSPVPSNLMPLIVVAVIMGVALAIALIVSHAHAKPQKLGGAKGDVW